MYLDHRQAEWADAERQRAVKYAVTPQGPRVFVDALDAWLVVRALAVTCPQAVPPAMRRRMEGA